MKGARQAIERGLDLYQELVGEPELTREFEESRKEFFAAGIAERSDRSMASRRHLEWFLLERPSEHLGGVPAEALLEPWSMRAGETERGLSAAFLQSLSGAFEITSSEPGRGLWVRDLFGLGEYPIEEAEAALELQPGDLLVGRIFPVGDGLFRLSPAVSCFRNPDLVSAVREDLERMRAARRGVLRIQQVELERLFFSSSSVASRKSDVPTIDLRGERSRARTALVESGLSAAAVEEVMRDVSEAAREGRPVVAELLDELAFGSDVDLGEARRALAELWAVETHGAERGGSFSIREEREIEEASSLVDVRAALDAFDRGRANGEDLEGLFSKLADDLGVEAPADDGEDTSLPDFPGVVGAMVEEFLWDVGREQGGHHAERMAGLRRLSRYGERIGMFEEFTRREILDFAGRWLLDRGDLSGPEEARAVLDALREFCRWCEDRQGFELRAQCDELIGRLSESIPRLVLVRQRCAPPGPDDVPWNVRDLEGEEATLLGEDGREKRLRLDGGLASLLRVGDLVHARTIAGTWTLTTSYPPELRELLDRESS